MEKRSAVLFVFLLVSSMSSMVAESYLQKKMKSFSQAVTDFRNLHKKCRSPQGCSIEERRKLRHQQGIIAATGGAIILAITGTAVTLLGRRQPKRPEVIVELPSLSSLQTIAEQRRSEQEELLRMRAEQHKLEEEARQKEWEAKEEAVRQSMQIHRVESEMELQKKVQAKEERRIAREEARMKAEKEKLDEEILQRMKRK